MDAQNYESLAFVSDDQETFQRSPAVIYALVDPRCGSIRYIGKTEIPSVRMRLHLWESTRNDTRKSLWIRGLLSVGLRPEFRELEWVPIDGDWGAAEKKHIAIEKGRGADLLNGTSGGQGVPNDARGEKWKAALRASHLNNPRRIAGSLKAAEKLRGRTHSDEHKEKIGAAFRGRKLTPEHVAKVAAAQRGKPRNPVSIAKMARSLAGRKQSQETQEKKRLAMAPHRAQQSERTRALWRDPLWRANALAKRRRK